MKYYTYGLKFYDPCDDTIERKYGIVAADSYGDAITKVVDVYGEDDIDDIKVSEMTNDKCVEILTEDEEGTIDWGYDAAEAFAPFGASLPAESRPQDPSDLSEDEEEEDDREFDFDEEYYDDPQDPADLLEEESCNECDECNCLNSKDWVKENGIFKKETKDDNFHKQEYCYSSNPKDTPVDIKNRISLYNEKMDETQRQINEAYKALIETLRRSYNRSGIAKSI